MVWGVSVVLFEGVVWGTGEDSDLARVEMVRSGWSWSGLTAEGNKFAKGLHT